MRNSRVICLSRHFSARIATVLALAVGMLAASSAHAQTCTVTDNSDSPSDSGSLRYCVNSAVSGEIIDFASSLNGQTITLSPANGALTIGTSLTIQGPGANRLTISGGNAVTVFQINSATVSISGLTIANGSAAIQGGGIYNSGGTLTVSNSILSGNTALNQGYGGGIASFGILTLSNSTVSGNSATFGGGIFCGGTLTVTNSTISGNTAGQGGGIHNEFNSTLTVTNSTFSGNTATGQGGAIYSYTNNFNSTLAVTNSTFSGNTATGQGGAIYSNPSNTSLMLTVSNSVLLSGDTCVKSTGGCPTNGSSGNVVGASTVDLLPLGYYGGPTQTMLPLPGSPAICAGSDALAVAAGVTADQRGFPLNSSCVDAGAVQTNYLLVTTTTDVTDGSPDCTSGTGNTCSLRDAMDAGNTAGYADIAFASSLNGGTITLSSTLPASTGQMNLIGPGANELTVSGNNSVQVLPVNSSAEAFLYGLTIANGDNAPYGSGINNGGTLTVSNSSISGNSAFGCGGGIFNQNGGALTVSNSTISGNAVYDFGDGGGICNLGGTLTVSNSTISGNSAIGGSAGGGIFNQYGGAVTLSNSTISGNSALASNYGGGGILNYDGTLTLSNSIVSGNTASFGYADIEGSYTDNGGNQASNNSSSTSTIAINLAPLGNYGGPTQTMVPLPGSPAICAGLSANILPGVTTDQRGYPNTNTTYTGYSSNSPCVDSGAVQTNYQSVQFSNAGSGYSGTVNQPVSPAPVVSVTENGQNIAGVPVTLGFSGTGIASGLGPVTTVAGTGAQFGSLSVNMTGSDTLSATLAIVGSVSLSASTGLSIAPAQIAPAVTFTGAPATAAYQSTFTVAATTNASTTAVITASGACSISGTLVKMTSGTGTCNLTANWAADSNYLAASATQSTSAMKIAPTVTFTGAPALALNHETFTVAASTNASTTATITASGVCTIAGTTVTMTASTGTCSLSADWAADANYLAASATQSTTATATKISQTITVTTTAPLIAVYQSTFTVSANASSGLPVAITVSGGCSIPSGTTGSGMVTMTSGTTGCTVTYKQAGNADYSAASAVTETVTAEKATQTITVTTAAPLSAAYQSTFTVAATSSSGLTVAYSPATGSGCTRSGATFTMTSGTTGCTVDFNQAGNANFAAATEVAETVSATLASQATLTVTGVPATAQPYGKTFRVGSSGGSGTGAVTFSASGACSNTGTTVTMTSGSGTCSVMATKAADSNYSSATSAAATVSATPATQTIKVTTAAPGSAVYNSTFTVAANASSGLPVAITVSGGCSMPSGTTGSGTVAMTSGTTACLVIFNQAGNTNYAAAAQVSKTVTAAKAPSTTVIASTTPNPSTIYQAVVIDFTVSGAGIAPTGTVTVTGTGSVTCTGTLSAGASSCSLTFTTAGSKTVKAVYAGDTNYKTSTSATVTQTVQP